MELHESLSNTSLNNYLDQQEIESLLKYNKFVSFASGDILLQQGKKSEEGIYFVISGDVIVSTKILNQGSTDLETLGPGIFLGEISFIEKIPSATSVIANTPVQCLFISRLYLEFLSTYFPQTKYKLFSAMSKQVCKKLNKMYEKITTFISSSDMTTKSIFAETLRLLTVKPIEINPKDGQSDINDLQKFPALTIFNKDEMNELLQHKILLKAPKNCTLIHKGEKNASSYIVIHGAVQSSITHENKEAKLSVIGPGTLFASVACVDNDAAFTITFATCEHAILLKLAESDLDFFQKNNPELWYKLFDLICKSLVALEKSVDKLDVRLNIETYNR